MGSCFSRCFNKNSKKDKQTQKAVYKKPSFKIDMNQSNLEIQVQEYNRKYIIIMTEKERDQKVNRIKEKKLTVEIKMRHFNTIGNSNENDKQVEHSQKQKQSKYQRNQSQAKQHKQQDRRKKISNGIQIVNYTEEIKANSLVNTIKNLQRQQCLIGDFVFAIDQENRLGKGRCIQVFRNKLHVILTLVGVTPQFARCVPSGSSIFNMRKVEQRQQQKTIPISTIKFIERKLKEKETVNMKKDGKEVENNSKSRLSLEETHHAAHKGSFAFWKPFSLEDSSDGRKFKEELRDNTHQNLPKIKLGYVNFTSFPILPKMNNLKRMEIKSRQIRVLDVRLNAPNLCPHNNRLWEIQGLQMLPQLQSLAVGDNRLKRISGISHLKQLKQPLVDACRIASIEGLSGCTSSLSILGLGNNKIGGLGDGLIEMAKTKAVKEIKLCILCTIVYGNKIVETERSRAKLQEFKFIKMRPDSKVYLSGNMEDLSKQFTLAVEYWHFEESNYNQCRWMFVREKGQNQKETVCIKNAIMLNTLFGGNKKELLAYREGYCRQQVEAERSSYLWQFEPVYKHE